MSKVPELKDLKDEDVLRVFGRSKAEVMERVQAVKEKGLPSAPAPADEFALPTEAELALTEKLKEVFAEIFAKREAEGTLWPGYFGEYALTRIVRGNAGDLTKMCSWFMSFIMATDELDFDGIARRNTERLERVEKEGRRLQESDFPHYEELSTKYGCYAGCVFSCPRLSPLGDPIGYHCVRTLHRKKDVWEGADNAYNKFVEHWLEATLSNMMEMDKMTRQQGRMVKKAWIFDFHQFGWSNMHKEFDAKFAEDVNQYEKRCMAEVTGNLFVLNVPWFFVKPIKFFMRQAVRTGLLEQRTADKVTILSDGGMSDPNVLKFVGAEQIALLYSQRPKSSEEDTDAALSGKVTIGARASFDRVLVVEPGQRVSWKFEVEQGGKLLAAADVNFRVVLITDPPEDSDSMVEMKEETLKGPENITCDMGECTGEVTVEARGMLRLAWSNEHSMMRSKGLTFAVDQA